MRVAIYDVITGKIKRIVQCSCKHIQSQVRDGEDFFLNCPEKTTHIIENESKTIIAATPVEDLLFTLRSTRNRLLADCDWTQLPDAQLSTTDKKKWTDYRQELRDLPTNCDPSNITWPPSPKRKK